MKRSILTFVCFFVVAVSLFSKGSLDLVKIVTGDFSYAEPNEMTPLLDSRYYVSLDSTQRKLISYEYTTGNPYEVLLDLNTVKGDAPKQIVGFILSPNESKVLVWSYESKIYRRSFTTEYFLYDRKRKTIEPLSKGGLQRDARFSPDSRSVAFARDNNLFIRRLDFGSEIQVTTDGLKNSVINGVSDWVYEEEFTETCAFDWSPDSKILSYVKFEEKNVPLYSIPLYGSMIHPLKPEKYYSSSYSFKYPSAGENNSIVSVWSYTLQSRSAKKMEIIKEDEDYIPRIRYTRNSDQLAVMVMNRSQNLFKMYFVNPKSAQGKLILTEQSETYLEPSYDHIFFNSKYFTYVGEKDGYRHLYVYGINGGILKQLTAGKWDMTEFLGCDTLKNIFYYQSNELGYNQRSVFSVDLKGKKKTIAAKKGSNEVSFNSDFSFALLKWSDLNTPPVYSLLNKDAKLQRIISENNDYKKNLSDVDAGKKEFISFPAIDGQVLNGWIMKPTSFDPQKKYPVILVQYSGPSSQNVLDMFDMDWEYYLVQQGFVVVSIDGRGTGGRGTAFRNLTYTKLGQLETEDQVSAVKWLKNQPGIDGARIGIWGWSYGGFITLMSMEDPSASFKAGIAVAPVVDWRYYNTVYTERYMKTPNENTTGYNGSSPILKAANLKGRLLLVYGMADDNVRSNQSMDFSEALIKAGIQFETQVYPTSNHSILGTVYRSHVYTRMVDFFKSNL